MSTGTHDPQPQNQSTPADPPSATPLEGGASPGAEGQCTGDDLADFIKAVEDGEGEVAARFYGLLTEAQRREALDGNHERLGRFLTISAGPLGPSGVAGVLREQSESLVAAISLAGTLGLTGADTLLTLLNDPAVTAVDQLAVAQDDAAIAAVRAIASDKAVHDVFVKLASDAAMFIQQAAGRAGAFADWLGADLAKLKLTIAAVNDLASWATIMHQPHDAWEQLVAMVIDDATGGEVAWKAAVTDDVFGWLVQHVKDGGSSAERQEALYRLLSPTRPEAQKRLMWGALYTMPLAPANTPYKIYEDYIGAEVHFDDTRLGSIGLPLAADPAYVRHDVDLRVYVDSFEPTSATYDTFFTQFRQIPTTHLNLASALVFGATTWKEWTYQPLDAAGAPTGASTIYYEKEPGDLALHATQAPAQVTRGPLYWNPPINTILIFVTSTSGAGAATRASGNDNAVGTAGFGGGQLPEAANGQGANPAAGTTGLSYLAQNITHEVGHAVGVRKLAMRDASGTLTGTQKSGNEWAQAYGDWQTHASAAAIHDAFMTQLGWVAALDAAKVYTIGGVDVSIPGTEVKAFFAAVAEGTAASATLAQATNGAAPPEARFGSVANVWTGLAAGPKDGSIDWTTYKFWSYLQNYSAANAYYFTQGLDGGGDRVHFWCTRANTTGWASYKRAMYNAAVSHYQLSSLAETFAELYTDWFNGNHGIAAVNGQNPADYFGALERAQPGDFGAAGTGTVAFGDGHGGAGGGFPSELADGEGVTAAEGPSSVPVANPPAELPSTPLATGGA